MNRDCPPGRISRPPRARRRPVGGSAVARLHAAARSSDAPTGPTGPAEELYNNGIDALNDRRFSTADDQFNAGRENYPYSSWAVNAQLMAGYSLYLQNKYTEAIGTLDRFIQLHPAHRDIAYAYYLRALCYYEQIADIERDQKGTEQAMNALREVVNALSRHLLRPGRQAEDRPLRRPSRRQGDGNRPLLPEPASV